LQGGVRYYLTQASKVRIVRTIKQDSVSQVEISFEHDLSPLVNVAILFLSVITIPITEINHILVFHYYCK
jgi:hypothetical protein